MTPRYNDSKREKIKTKTRRALLNAAIMEFARYGYDGANINRISEVAGFAKGTIYNYFDSKRALMLALIEDISVWHYEYISKRVLIEEHPDRRVEVFYQAGFDFVSDYLSQGLVMVNNLYGHDDEFKQAMYTAYAAMFELVGRDIIAYGIAQGSFRQVDPSQTSGMLMNIYLGVASQVDEGGKTWLNAEQVSDFVLHALRERRM